MRLHFINRISQILFLCIFISSCSSDLDFDQTKDLKLEPAFVANLAYFDVPAASFIDNGTEQQIGFDVQNFEIFKEKFFKDNLVKAEFDFEMENTINRAFTLNILLLNDNNQILQTITLAVPAYSGGSNVIKYPTEVFENQRLDLLKQSRKLGFVVVMAPGPPLNGNSAGSLKLRSSATAYMVIE
ncbi:hypothetical protein ACHRVW_08050 [Flavobacterium collinsii]|jgi:hypothetical protein|uniref:hypothetical protein n=1 Tax=Flavobacterium collinsii TaxID=1114861 RepID=UPI0037570E08